MRRNRKSVDVEHAKSSGFSGKLKSVGSFGKQKKNNDDDSFSFPEELDDLKKAPRRLFDSGELYPSMPYELKSSTARTPANKVCRVFMNVQCDFCCIQFATFGFSLTWCVEELSHF